MRRIELLIKSSRSSTENKDLNGISQDDFIEYFNNGQDIIQSMIQNVHPETELFSKEGYISIITNQDAYDLTVLEDIDGNTFDSRILTRSAISLVERSENADSYFPLKFISNKERKTGFGYYFMDKYIIIAPEPRTGKIRVTFTQRLANVDIRRGQISAVNPNTSLVLTSSTIPSGTEFEDIDYCCVVDKDGNIIRGNIAINSFTSPTINTSDDLTGISVGDYVCYGKYSTTHSELPDILEMMLIEYVNYRVSVRDSSVDSKSLGTIVDEMKNQMSELFSDQGNDVMHIPISSTDYMNY